MRSEPLQIPDEPASTPDDARARYLRTRNLDPFPDISPALLNSADIYDYIRATGMILPFEESRLNKPASYEASIGRRYIYWTPDGKNVDLFLDDNQEFVLYPNSIGFITTEEFFRLPHYIAARFNLRITNVHRGLLVGTGPLVDPGFSGQLLIPLHNLTTNEYRFRRGERFAWFEFTKLSLNAWNPGYDDLRRRYSLRGEFVPFPDEKIEIAQDPRRYLAEAAPDGVRSSIPEAIAESAQSAEHSSHEARRASASAEGARAEARQASTASEEARSTLFRIGIGAGVAGVVAVAALWYDSRQLATQVNESVERLRESYVEFKDETQLGRTSLAQEIEALARDTQDLQRSVGAQPGSIQSQMDDLRAQVERLQDRIGGGQQQ